MKAVISEPTGRPEAEEVASGDTKAPGPSGSAVEDFEW